MSILLQWALKRGLQQAVFRDADILWNRMRTEGMYILLWTQYGCERNPFTFPCQVPIKQGPRRTLAHPLPSRYLGPSGGADRTELGMVGTGDFGAPTSTSYFFPRATPAFDTAIEPSPVVNPS
jgi:hypothetical protein